MHYYFSRDRSSNFGKEETNKLILLLKDYPVITCKKTDHSSNKQKDAAWKLLADKFNSDATTYRSVKQLQQKYNNIKKTARTVCELVLFYLFPVLCNRNEKMTSVTIYKI